MPTLFETTTINGLKIPNRFVRSATFEGMAEDDGSCSERLIHLMAALAKGGVGLIITGHSYVSEDGKQGRWRMGIESDRQLPGLSRMSQAVHREGGKIVVQLAHGGCHSSGGPDGRAPMGPSRLDSKPGCFCREMTRAEIHRVVEDFGRAAARAREAGFDGVQIHAAHGYLLSQFLCPFFNKRPDEYGGNVENRARLTLEVFQQIRLRCGQDYPVLLKINSEDFVQNGLKTPEMIEVCRRLEAAGVDAIEISGGTQLSGDLFPARPGHLRSEDDEVYYREAARLYKSALSTPLILVGGIRSCGVAERLVQEGLADYVALSRPLIREPDLVNRWKAGDTRRSGCRSDNLCLEAARAGHGISCVEATRRGPA